MGPTQRRIRTPSPVDVHTTLSSLGRGRHDPAFQRDGQDTVWWTTQTPGGLGTIRFTTVAVDGGVDVEAWGEGTEWLLQQAPALVGECDDPAGFTPHHGVVEKAWHRNRRWRIPRTGRVFEACVAAVIEQKVTGQEARAAWAALLAKFGERAPGPTPIPMFAPPLASVWSQLPEWEFRRVGVTPHRIRAVWTVARTAGSLDRLAERGTTEADRVLQSLPGVGPWTSAETRARALGDPDAVSVGDFHVAKDLCWWLTGKVGDDEQMLDLLAPYAGHRYRVQRLMELSGAGAPRRGPRFTPPVHRRF